uniref:1,3-beta-glucanosyltransferase n=1 Tax=Bionectria ochroleuca TaxID=29856 RepID=A0A8H7TUE4_BIOOC
MLRFIAYGVLLFATLVASISPISIKGSKLYDQDGKQFFVKGVIYAGVGEIDVLRDGKQCQLDAGLMKDLGINTIRVYGADSTKDHKECMEAFASKGIYVWVDLSTESRKIDDKTPEWTMNLYTNFTSTIDHFAGYDNVLAFTLGFNTLDNTIKGSVAGIAIKAAARDLKAFRDARGYRPIPIVYAQGPDEPHTSKCGQFVACGDNTVDMFGINNDIWCDISSGLDMMHELFKDYNIPIVFSETGCGGDNKRNFSEVYGILGVISLASSLVSLYMSGLNRRTTTGLRNTRIRRRRALLRSSTTTAGC